MRCARFRPTSTSTYTAIVSSLPYRQRDEEDSVKGSTFSALVIAEVLKIGFLLVACVLRQWWCQEEDQGCRRYLIHR